MKKLVIFALAAIMVLGLAISSQATLIINNSGEPTLWSIITGWTGLSSSLINQAGLESASPLETLDAGSYTVLNNARYAGFSQTLDGPSGNLLTLNSGNVDTSANIPFTEAATFGFTDKANGLVLTIQNQNGPSKQSNGFVCDLYTLSGNQTAYAGQYIVAFEDGGNPSMRGYGDSDCNDFVARVKRMPIPPSALLMGSGLFGLGLLGWRRRYFG